MTKPAWKPTELELFFTKPVKGMGTRSPRFVEASATVGDAIRVLQTERIGSVLIRDAAGRLVGIFTERDVMLRILGRGVDADKAPVSEYMTSDPETLEDTATVAMALNKMHLGHYRHLPLVDESGLPTGFVSVKDLVGYLARRIESAAD